MSNTSTPLLPSDEADTAGKSDLRRQAEKKAAMSPEHNKCLSLNETRLMIHELRVHQIELEMQNEELRQTQEDLNAARVRYFDLYDLAPVGYVAISEMGLIQEVNLCASTLLGVLRNRLIGQLISHYILNDDQDGYYLFRKMLPASGEPQTCDLRMIKSDGSFFWVHLSATLARNADNAPVCRLVLIDMTERKRAEAELQQTCDELERFNNLVVGRELRMIALKAEINALLKAAGQPDKYKIIGADE
jgi:PAS domain S-box-containing protein